MSVITFIFKNSEVRLGHQVQGGRDSHCHTVTLSHCHATLRGQPGWLTQTCDAVVVVILIAGSQQYFTTTNIPGDIMRTFQSVSNDFRSFTGSISLRLLWITMELRLFSLGNNFVMDVTNIIKNFYIKFMYTSKNEINHYHIEVTKSG